MSTGPFRCRADAARQGASNPLPRGHTNGTDHQDFTPLRSRVARALDLSLPSAGRADRRYRGRRHCLWTAPVGACRSRRGCALDRGGSEMMVPPPKAGSCDGCLRRISAHEAKPSVVGGQGILSTPRATLLEKPLRGPLGNCVRSIGRHGQGGCPRHWLPQGADPPAEESPPAQQEAGPQRIAQLAW